MINSNKPALVTVTNFSGVSVRMTPPTVRQIVQPQRLMHPHARTEKANSLE